LVIGYKVVIISYNGKELDAVYHQHSIPLCNTFNCEAYCSLKAVMRLPWDYRYLWKRSLFQEQILKYQI